MSEGSSPPPPPGDPSALLLSLLHLSPRRFALLRLSASTFLALCRRRLLALLLSPALFSLSLSRLRSLPLTSKTSLLARLLLRPLHIIASAHHPLLSPSSPPSARDLDVAVLLLAMCDSLPEDDPPATITDDQWRLRIARGVSASALSIAGLGREAEFAECVDAAIKCCRLLVAAEGDGGKMGRMAAASTTAVIRLAAAADGGWCAVCREETAAEACGMPCGHRFHWGCILPWLRRRNTCPCCRFELPADDVFCEIGRMWRAVVVAGRRPPMGRV